MTYPETRGEIWKEATRANKNATRKQKQANPVQQKIKIIHHVK